MYTPHDVAFLGKDNDDDSITHNNNDTLLDFAVIGFPKCGTSTMMHYLSSSNETSVPLREMCHLSIDKPNRFIQALHKSAPIHEVNVKRGIKCPKGE